MEGIQARKSAKAGRGKGGRGKVAGNPEPEGDFHEAYARSGHFSREGRSASFHETNSGSRTEAPGQAPWQAHEWLAAKEQQGKFHNFGEERNYPWDWPPRYFQGGHPYCPPQVLGQAEAFFKEAKGNIFNFFDRAYKFIGPDRVFRVKPHWEPHPYPGRGRRRRGARPGRGPRKEPQGEEDLEEEESKEAGEQEEHQSRGWFS
jgi:hypothetical protein